MSDSNTRHVQLPETLFRDQNLSRDALRVASMLALGYERLEIASKLRIKERTVRDKTTELIRRGHAQQKRIRGRDTRTEETEIIVREGSEGDTDAEHELL